MEISFQQTIYSVMESGDVIEVCVNLSGILGRNVTVSLSTSTGSEISKFCHTLSLQLCLMP